MSTKVGENKVPSESEGWTIELMDCASLSMKFACGERN